MLLSQALENKKRKTLNWHTTINLKNKENFTFGKLKSQIRQGFKARSNSKKNINEIRLLKKPTEHENGNKTYKITWLIRNKIKQQNCRVIKKKSVIF